MNCFFKHSIFYAAAFQLLACNKIAAKLDYNVQTKESSKRQGILILAGKSQTIEEEGLSITVPDNFVLEDGYLRLVYQDNLKELLQEQSNYAAEKALSQTLEIIFVNKDGKVMPTSQIKNQVTINWRVDLTTTKNIRVVKISEGRITPVTYNLIQDSDGLFSVTFVTSDLNAYYGVVQYMTQIPNKNTNTSTPKVVSGGLVIASKFQPRKYFQTRSMIIIKPKNDFFVNGDEYAITATPSNKVILENHDYGTALTSPELDIYQGYHYFYSGALESKKWFQYGENQITFASFRGNEDLIASDKFYIQDFTLSGISLRSHPTAADSPNLESWVNPVFNAFSFSQDQQSLMINGAQNIYNY